MPRVPRETENALPSKSSYPLGGSLSQELANQLASYRELLDGARAIVWRADAQTFQFTFVSRFAEILLGYPLQQWSEPGFWEEHIHPDDREWVVTLCINATKEKRAHEIDYRMVAADGRVLWIRDICNLVMENDEPSELVGVIVDVTEKKKAELALQRSEEYLRQVIDTIPQEIWSGTADGTIDYCNLRWRTELGVSLESLRADGWRRIIHPDDQDLAWATWSESIANGTPYEQQLRYRMANGQYRWFLSRSVPLRDAQGNIVRWFGTNTDIHDQKEAEEALRLSEQRWRGVFDNSSVGIALQDGCLRYVDANPAFCRMVGYSCDELRKMTCMDITHADDRETYREVIAELLSGQKTRFEFEKRYIRKDGKLIWTHLNGSMIAHEGGDRNSALWVVIEEDISERKRLHDELTHERDRLRLLIDVNKAFAPKLDIQEFFDALSNSLGEIERWEYSFVALPDSATDLKVHLAGPARRDLRLGLSAPIDGSSAGKAFRSGQPEFFRVADFEPVPGYPKLSKWREFARADGLQAGWNLPLLYDGQVLGVLGVHTRRDPDAAITDRAFLEELAKLVAIALHNALRYGELSESHEKISYEKKFIEAEFLREQGIGRIVGHSSGMTEVMRQISAVAPTDAAVLITGETGTGKELVARAIHDRSPRRDRNFVKVDCAAIPASLIESELFGHEKGAFTGATAQKLGRFEIADKGTLFLDEVGDIPLELQTKLLRVLQDHAFERLGSNRTVHVDVRIVAATHRNLETAAEQGKFREDLYYRLRVFPITIPPLRERTDDIPSLVKHYVEFYARRMKKEVPTVSPAAMEAFLSYRWPGNVRELRHFIERSVVLTSGRQLQAPLSELKRMAERQGRRTAGPRRTLVQVERDAIVQALEESNWTVGGPGGAAARLGLKRTTLASRMEKLGISRDRHE